MSVRHVLEFDLVNNRSDMTKKKTAAIILAAGLGTRMESDKPKVLHTIAGRAMISHLMETLGRFEPDRIAVVIGNGMEGVADSVAPHPCCIQEPRLGTGHAVLAAKSAMHDFDGDVLIVYGDTPLVSQSTFEAMLETRRATRGTGAVVLGFRPDDPGAYGRLVVGDDGSLEAIVEAKEATPEQLAIPLCNSGVMAIDGARLFGWLARIGNANAKGEYYLTDLIELARADGLRCAFVEAPVEELLGINSRADLAVAEAVVQTGLRARAMVAGVTMIDPASVFLSWDTQLGRDVVIGPNVVFGPGVTVGEGTEILPFSHLEGATVGAGVRVGPFARLRPGADIADTARIGNFVEIKNASIELGAKVSHLTYIGDARVGPRANIGAGTITCNYDGFFKDRTDIGADAFIGSNTALVAPVKVGDGATTGAGSVITKDVPADALALTRAPMKVLAGWAKQFRKRRAAEKKKG